jgi:hypothetical protein
VKIRGVFFVSVVLWGCSAFTPLAHAQSPKLLCNSVEAFGGNRTFIYYKEPKVRPRKCAVWREGWAHFQALTFINASWRGWGSDRAVGRVTVTGNSNFRAPGTVVLTRLREKCGQTVYTRVRMVGVRKAWRPDTCALARSERFCGWRDLANGGWTMGTPDRGAYSRLFARKMPCRAARRAYNALDYEQEPPYRPILAGYGCHELESGYEYSDVRCARLGSDASFRYQTGS